MGASGDKGV
jgi:hypothetical protein